MSWNMNPIFFWEFYNFRSYIKVSKLFWIDIMWGKRSSFILTQFPGIIYLKGYPFSNISS